MKAFVITLPNDEYSKQVTERCLKSADKYNISDIDKFEGVNKNEAVDMMEACGLKWAWKNGKTCPITGLYMKPYGVKDWNSKIGCSMSHYLLWRKCVHLNEPILILEHDAVFIRELTQINVKFACQINDPLGSTPKGKWWSEQMKKRGNGIFHKTKIPYPDNRPDGLSGNGSYIITPIAAKELTLKVHEIGLWINDSFLCIQLFPDLEEHYPFITEIQQEKSTSSL